MRVNFHLFVLTVAFVGVLFTSGQGQEICPTFSVNGPNGVIDVGKIAPYQVNIGSLSPDLALTFTWTVSYGIIKKGQGTRRIEVIQPANCITASVEVGGLPATCPFRFSETSCGDPPPLPEKLIEISGSLNKTKIGLASKALERFSVDKNAIAYVIIYAARKSDFRNKAEAIQELFGHDFRVTFVYSHSKHSRIVIWAVSAGATPPVP